MRSKMHDLNNAWDFKIQKCMNFVLCTCTKPWYTFIKPKIIMVHWYKYNIIVLLIKIKEIKLRKIKRAEITFIYTILLITKGWLWINLDYA